MFAPVAFTLAKNSTVMVVETFADPMLNSM